MILTRLQRLLRSTLLTASMFIVPFGSGCEENGQAASKEQKNAPAAIPVSVAKAQRRDVPLRVRAIGYVEALATVTMRAQIDGQIEKAHFVEGGAIKEGDLLYTIDARPFEAALQMAEATVEKAKSLAERSEREAVRIEKLFKQDQASDREQDMASTEAKSAAAEVQARQADLKMAQLNLDYCRIRSPMNGRAGSFLVHPGTIVEKNKTDLVVINQLSPIHVLFSLPEQYLSRAKSAAENGHNVTIQLTGDSDAQSGSLSFVDNAVDRTTGMIRLKATFENADRRLWPGAYGTVELTVENLPDAVVVPATAVQQGLRQPFVFIVKSDNTVEVRNVTSSHTIEGETVVTSGLQGGETVVVDGQMRLTQGAPVTTTTLAETTTQPTASAQVVP